MNSRGRTTLMATTAPPKHNHCIQVNEKEEAEAKAEMLHENVVTDLRRAAKLSQSSRERKVALQQEIDKLKKRLRHEENVHRALERAFTRPLGVLPRLPPYLPPQVLELLAEVAVLEEEVVRLEEQVVNSRQGLYQDTIFISSSKKLPEGESDLYPCPDANKFIQPRYSSQFQDLETSASIFHSAPHKLSSDREGKSSSSNQIKASKKPLKIFYDHQGKEKVNNVKSPQKKASNIIKACDIQQRLQENSPATSDETKMCADVCPNRISEDLVKCLSSIYKQMCTHESRELDTDAASSTEDFKLYSKGMPFQDPYGTCIEFGRREIGPYMHFLSIDKNSINPMIVAHPSLIRKLRFLLEKLELVDLKGLGHQQKLAFWINIYNSCMMNSFLENGIPSNAQMVVASVQKAVINAGGRLLSSMTIEHFILRLPYNSNNAFIDGCNDDMMAASSCFRLDWPEPLVTFALSCGSWSSPAVRLYTATQVEDELEIAKRDYLQAAVRISGTNKLAIPKLLDLYLHDFAKDVESLADWICLQLPDGLRNYAVTCLERERREALPRIIQVMPYDFSFRFLLAT